MIAAITTALNAIPINGPYKPRPTGTWPNVNARIAVRSAYGVIVEMCSCIPHFVANTVRIVVSEIGEQILPDQA